MNWENTIVQNILWWNSKTQNRTAQSYMRSTAEIKKVLGKKRREASGIRYLLGSVASA